MGKTAIIVTSLLGAGLEREARLLQDLLQSDGFVSTLLHYTDLNTPLSYADITVSLEAIQPRVFSLSKRHFFVPNSEWWWPENERYLPKFEKILCKTQDCYRIWSRKVGADRCVFTSWEARDIMNNFPRQRKFLHLAGQSAYKNTEAVFQAWKLDSSLPPLTVVCSNPEFNRYYQTLGANVRHFYRISEVEVIQMSNNHLFHIMPSLYEGFGHSLHEGLGCGAIMLTTGAPPMNEFLGIPQELTIPVLHSKPKAVATLNYVSPEAVIEKVKEASLLLPEHISYYSHEARSGFLRNREYFRRTLRELVQ